MAASSLDSSQDGEAKMESNILEIPYSILLECILNSNLSVSSPLLQDILCTFICQQIGIEPKSLPKNANLSLALKIKKFLTTIRAKKGSRSRHIERVLEEPWAKGAIILPRDTFLSPQHPTKKKTKPKPKLEIIKKKAKTFNTLSTRGKFLAAQRL